MKTFTFDFSHESSPNSLCHFSNHKSAVFKILIYPSVPSDNSFLCVCVCVCVCVCMCVCACLKVNHNDVTW